MDKKRTAGAKVLADTVVDNKRVKLLCGSSQNQEWEWPVHFKQLQVLPFWAHSPPSGQARPELVQVAQAVPVERSAQDISLGTWAAEQAAVVDASVSEWAELHKSKGRLLCIAVDPDTEDTATSSCSEDSIAAITAGCHKAATADSGSSRAMDEQQLSASEDDSINSTKPYITHSTAFRFNALPVVVPGQPALWPAAAAVAAQ